MLHMGLLVNMSLTFLSLFFAVIGWGRGVSCLFLDHHNLFGVWGLSFCLFFGILLSLIYIYDFTAFLSRALVIK